MRLKSVIIRSLVVLVNFALVAALVMLFQNCGRAPHKTQMKLGEKKVIKPIPQAQLSSDSYGKYQNIRMLFDMGGIFVQPGDDVQIQGFASVDDSDPLYSFSPGELAMMYETTDCPSHVIAMLDSAIVGDALFCNGRFDPNRVGYWVANRPGKRTKTATSMISEGDSPDFDIATYIVAFD